MTDFDFDFGFTAVDEYELETVQKAHEEANVLSADAQALQKRLDDLYNSILPLLNNLKKNPDKDYILWPNRIDKIEEFKSKLDRIHKGE